MDVSHSGSLIGYNSEETNYLGSTVYIFDPYREEALFQSPWKEREDLSCRATGPHPMPGVVL